MPRFRATFQAPVAPGVLHAVPGIWLLRPENRQHDRGEILGHHRASGEGGL